MDMCITRLYLNQSCSMSLSPDHSGHVKPTGDSIFLDQDLLTLILVHVPLRKLMQFKCVSKPWHFFINSHHFFNLRSMLPLPPPFGLFVQGPFSMNLSDPVYYIPLQDGYNDNQHRGVRTPTFCHDLFGPHGRNIRILDSSHGLLLCCTYFLEPKPECDHYIYNPTTNQLATLPRPTDQSFLHSVSMILAFRPSKSPHYKVIACARLRQSMSLVLRQFEIYSSETKSWRVSGQPFPQPVGMELEKGVYCNGSIYWISELKSEAKSANCLFFNVDEERLGTFPGPPIVMTSSSIRSLYFGESEDHLHFIEVCPYATLLLVYEMKCDHSGWFLIYQVELAPLSKAFPQHGQDDYLVDVLLLARRDKFQEDDSFLVLGIPGKAISYNLVNRSFKEMLDHKEVFDQDVLHLLGHVRLKVWQYVECHSSV